MGTEQFLLETFGHPVLRSSAGDSVAGLRRKDLALLVYLSVEAKRTHTRSYLAGLLWAETREELARHSVAQALARIRKFTDDTLLTLDRETVRLTGHIICDVVLLLGGDPQIVSDELLLTAESHDFLEGFYLGAGAETFDEWVENRRREVRDVAARLRSRRGDAVTEQIVEIPPPEQFPDDLLEEAVPIHADHPARVDALGRRSFAEVIAARLDEVWSAMTAGRGFSMSAGSFMLHLHGPWGSGKSSVLNFLKATLQDPVREETERWVVIDFNAWQHQRIRPPWWTLIKEIYAASVKQVGFVHSVFLRLRWFWWRLRMDWLAPTLTLILILLSVSLAADVFQSSSGDSGGGEFGKAVELGLKILSALFVAGAAALTASRSLLLGSARAAQTYTELSRDPLRPVLALYKQLVGGIRRPVAVFIDDLDRCDGSYVVELLEGIQTLFQTVPVAYVVAADRKWICASFEQKYAGFNPVIGDPGRPLGYLFLDKLFQVSIAVPRPLPNLQRDYWHDLLRLSHKARLLEKGSLHPEVNALAEEIIGLAHTPEELQQGIERAGRKGFVLEQAARAIAAKRISSRQAETELRHRLQSFADLLEPNPRTMKRLVNAYGLHQATFFLEGREVDSELLARWTVLEVRWPVFAECLAEHPDVLSVLLDGAGADDTTPELTKSLLANDALLSIIRGGSGQSPLNAAGLRRMIGIPDGK